jgi:nucleotide-binding universal stress UspA family protein
MNILIATIGPYQADISLHLGKLFYQITDGEITLLKIYKHEKDKVQAEASVAWAERFLMANAPKITLIIKKGSPAKEILKEVASEKYDLLIIEEREHLKLKKRLLSASANSVLDKIPCPILIARGEPNQIKRVLVCDSGCHPSLLNRLIKNFSPLLAHVNSLTVLHVMSQMAAQPGVPGWELRAEAYELIEEQTLEGKLLEEDLERLNQLNTTLEAKIRHGLVVKEILEEASVGDYDMVIIGAHRFEGWKRFLLENIATELIDQINKPLLVV